MQKEKGIKSKILTDEPELFEDVKWVWNAFQLLNDTRNYGFGGPVRVTMSDVAALLHMRGITDGDDIDFFLLVFPQMDTMWLDDHYKQAEKKAAAEKRKKR